MRILEVPLRLDVPRTPDWRWYRAHQCVYWRDYSEDYQQDSALRRAVWFIQRRESGVPLPSRSSLVAAYELYSSPNNPTRWKLEALTLARQNVAAIAQRLNLRPRVIKRYRSIFFDAQPWLRNRRWIPIDLFGCAPMVGFGDDLATLWKWIAYYRGIEGLDRAIAYTTGEGREKYSEAAMADTGVFVESVRLRVDKHQEQIIRLNHRQQVEENGLHLSACYQQRTRKVHESDDGVS